MAIWHNTSKPVSPSSARLSALLFRTHQFASCNATRRSGILPAACIVPRDLATVALTSQSLSDINCLMVSSFNTGLELKYNLTASARTSFSSATTRRSSAGTTSGMAWPHIAARATFTKSEFSSSSSFTRMRLASSRVSIMMSAAIL
ncbi:hypothetical protein D3C73_1240670 [compost metagenome]